MTENDTFSCQFFTPDGTKMYYTMIVRENVFIESKAFSAAALANGLTHEAPGLDDANSQVITTVMRRAKGDGTPIIDFYPEWGFPVKGKETYGTYRALGVYLNKDQPEETAAFLAASGFRSLEDIPLYDGQSPYKRDELKRHPKETAVPTPFKLLREQGEEKIGSDGKSYRPWKLVRYETINGGTVDNTPKNEPQGSKEPFSPLSSIDDRDTSWNTVKTKVEDFCTAITTYFASQRVRLPANEILGAINIITQQSASRFSELVNISQADAWAACLLQMANGNKDAALAQVKGDAVLTRAINFWASPSGSIDF